MKKKIIYILLFAIIGLVLGYFIFARINGEYLSIQTIFNAAANPIESFGRKITGLQSIKQNIFISGGVGAAVGLVLSLIKKK